MDVREIVAGDLEGVARLCARELVVDRYAETIPAMLQRQPRIVLVACRGSEPIGACFGSVGRPHGDGLPGFIDLFVVAREHRRQGIARRLFGEMEGELARRRGCSTVRIQGHPPHYAWPGVDVRYTPAICLAEDLGYRRGRCEVNMAVDLERAPLDTDGDADRIRSEGVEVRRAETSDRALLTAAIAADWWPALAAEVAAALGRTDAGVHLALRSSRCVGFCAWGVNRVNEVGPLGAWPDARRHGIGAVLIKRCLAEQRDRGLGSVDLMWTGPLSYFSTTLGATISRVFWQYEKDLV
jgi:GNAT superfamily N-acetyltransferase